MQSSTHPHFNVLDIGFGWVIEAVDDAGRKTQLVGVYRSKIFADRTAQHLEKTEFGKPIRTPFQRSGAPSARRPHRTVPHS